MNKSVFNGILLACVLGLTACGDNSKSKSNSDSNPGIALAGEYKVGFQCVDDAAQANVQKMESIATFTADGKYSIKFKIVEKCDQGCNYEMSGTYKLSESSFVITQTYQKDIDRNEESHQIYKQALTVQGIEKDQEKIIALHDSDTNMCNGPAIYGFNKVK